MTINIHITKLWQLLVLLGFVFLAGVAVGGKFMHMNLTHVPKRQQPLTPHPTA
jgi:hypothetical protein